MFSWNKEKMATVLTLILSLFFLCGSIIMLYKWVVPICGTVLGAILVMLFPLIISWLIGILVQPLINWGCDKLRLPRSLAVLLVLLGFMGLAALLVVMIVSRVVLEIANLSLKMPDLGAFATKIAEQLKEMYYGLNLSNDTIAKLQDWMQDVTGNIISWASNFANGAFDFLQSTPLMLMIILVTLVATFYFCKDMHLIQSKCLALFPVASRSKAKETYGALVHTISGYIHAQAILVSISTLICMVVFYILGVKGVLTLGLIVGFCDVLPVLGPGTIIVPWVIYSFVTENYFMAIGLLIMYVCLIVARNLLEAKLVGDRVGLHPLATLVAMLVGLKLFGVLGLIFGPILLALVIAFVSSNKKVAE